MAKEIVIYDVDGSVILTAPLTKSAEWECKVMTSDQVTLSWVDAEQVTIPMGAFVINPINNLRYYSVEPYVPAMKDTAKYEYKPVFYHEIFTLNKIPFLLYTYDANGNVESVESDWNFTGSGADLALQLEHAIEQGIGTTYTVEIDPVITASLSLSFGNVDILSAINDMADAWECEWWTDEQINGEESDKVIHFGKLCQHYGTGSEPLKLTAGVEVECPQSNNKATFYNRFYVFGGTNNIPQDYNGAQANHVVNKRLTLNPEKFPNGYIDLPKFDDDGNALKDEDGNYIPDDSLTSSTRRYTKVLQFNDIYPKCNCRIKYGTLKSCQRYVRDDNDDLIKLADGTYDQWYLYCFKLEYQEDGGAWKDFTINKSTYSEKTNPNGSIIKGKTLSLHFNSGALEGREFEATYHDASKTFRSEDGSSTFTVDAGYFEVVHSEDNTIILPNTGIAPSEGTNGNHDGDKVVVFNIRMPESYYQTAYTELEAEAIEEIWDETKDSNEYTVKTNQVYFSKSNPHLTLGRRVELWQGNKSSETRVIGLKECLDRQFDASITFGKKIRTGTISTLLTEVTENAAKTQAVSVANEVAIKMNKQQLYAAQRELYDSMFDTDGNFTAPISPLAVQTAMLSVGATSQNFQLADITFVPNDPTTGSETPYNCFRVDCGKSAKLVHYGLDYEATEPTEWTFSNQNLSDELRDLDAVYYLYALCPKDGTEGIFELTTEQRKYDSMLDTTGEYCFLVGVLSSASTDDNGTCRVLNLSYGSTTVNGRFVRTGRIESVDGGTYFDLDTGEIGGNIKFKATSDNTSVINSIINGNSTVKNAVSTANSAASTASSAASSASSAASSAASAASSASSAASTATAAKSAIDNFNAGTRNFIKNSAANMTLTYYNANTFNRATLVDGADGMTFDDENTYAWISYYIDGWTETFPPSNQGFNLGGLSDGTETWKWGGSYMVDSGYKQINSTTRRYWYKATSKGMKLTRCGLYTNNTSYKPTTDPVVYNVMLSFGSALADYTEAPEDVDSAISTAQTTANNAATTATSAASTATAAQTTAATAKETAEALANAKRNYIRGTKAMKMDSGTWATGTFRQSSSGGTMAHVDMDAIISETGVKCPCDQVSGGIRLSCSSTTVSSQIGFCQDQFTGFKTGDTLLLSAYVWASRAMRIKVLPYWTSTIVDGTSITYIDVPKGWSRVQATYTTVETTTASIGYFLITSQTLSSSDTTLPVLIVCAPKLELSTVATAWTEAPEDTDYLREALTEATEGTTSITGGLVLSNMISVGSGSNGLLAGMCGTSQAGDGSFPMIWAGATAQSKEGVMSAKFRVYNDGQAIMSAAKILGKGSGNTGMVMDNGAITFGKLTGDNIAAADKLTEITTTTYDTIQATLNGMESADVKGDPTVSKTITPTWNSANNQGGEMSSADSTTTLLSFTVGSDITAGNLFFTPSGKVTSFAVKSSLVSSYKATYYNNSVSATLSLVIRRNGADVATIYTKTLSDNKNSSTTTAIAIATASASTTNETVDTTTRSIVFAPGDTFTLVAKMTYNSFIYTVPNHSLKHTTGTDAYSATLNIGLSYTSKAPVYNNVYFANGMFLSSANTQYFAVVPKDPTIFQARSSNALLKFGADGLMQSLNGGTRYYRANPLYCAFKLVYESASTSGYACTWVYNPMNLTAPTARREAAGNIYVTHNFNLSTYYPQGAYVCTGNTEYSRTVMFDNLETTALRVHLMIGNSHYDPQNTGGVDYVVIYIYDFATYKS